MNIKCGKCSKYGAPVYHQSVADVAACFAGSRIPTVDRDGSTTVAPTPTPSQVADPPDRSGYSGERVNLRELEDQCPEGRYAVTMTDDRLHFFRLDKPDSGRWAGFTFVKEQASDNLFPVKNPSRRKVILEAISKDPAEAMLRYGLELGKCGHCGRTLTNEESRAAGIGPICRGKMPAGFFKE